MTSPHLRRSRLLCSVGFGLALSAGPLSAWSQSLTVEGSQSVSETRRLDSLQLLPGATLSAAPGRNLTLVVDGAAVPATPGDYRGRVELAVTEDILVSPMLGGDAYHDRTALFVDGKVDPSRSIPGLTGGAVITDTRAEGLRLSASDPGLTGIVIQGDANYHLVRPRIRLSGAAGDDSVGLGAAIRIGEDARVTITQADIETWGVIRTALFVDGRSQVEVLDSRIETFGGELPAGYEFSILPGKMMEVPYGLGLTGTTRSTNIQGTATVSYIRTHIIAHGWGALSTDGEGPAHMIVKDSRIETVGSGYGAYANGSSTDLFDNTTFDVTDYVLIVGGPGSGHFTNGTVARSDRYGVMMHQGSGGGVVTFDGKSRLETASTAILVKGRGTTINIDDATITPANGVLLQLMANDDPVMRDFLKAGPPPPSGDPRAAGAPPPPGAAPGGPPGPPSDMPGAGAPVFSGDVEAFIRRAELRGDVFHAMAGHALNLTLDSASLEGRITTSVATPRSGHETSRERFMEVGDVVNAPTPAGADHRLNVSLLNGARWTVTGTSHVSRLSLAEGAHLAAPAGARLELRVNGRLLPLAAGVYEGAVELKVL